MPREEYETYNEFFDPPHRPRWARWLVWLYAAALVAVTLVLYVFGDRTWWGTAVLFGPRWLWLLPWPVLTIAALFWCGWWSRGLALGSGLFWCLAIWGWVIPLDGGRGRQDGAPLRVFTCNLADGLTHYPSLERLLRDVDPDIAAFQESGEELEQHLPEGWRSLRVGKVVIASRYSLRPRVYDSQFYAWGIFLPIGNLVEVAAPSGPLLFAAVHFDSPRPGLLRILDRQTILEPSRRGYLEWLIELRRAQQARVRRRIDGERGELPTVVAGDFNTPVESSIYRAVWGDLANAFSRAGWGTGESIQVSVRGIKYGARIDHILFDPRWRCGQAWIGPWIGSDHRPVIADLWPYESGR